MAGFYSGKICAKHPHLDGRRTRSSGECTGCRADAHRRRITAKPPEYFERQKALARERYARLSPEDRAALSKKCKRYTEARRASDPTYAQQLRAQMRASQVRRRQAAPEGKQRRLARARRNDEFGFLRYDRIDWRGSREERPTREQLQSLWKSQNGRCALTGVPLDGVTPHLDHSVPRSRGGTDCIANLQWTHPAANHAKGTMTVAEFREWLLAAADALREKIALETLL